MFISLKNILLKYNLKPSKRLGQNFLIDKSVLGKIIQAADMSPNDVVLEVGPGLGILTLELAKHVKKVIAVEKDKRIIEILRKILAEKNIKNVEVIEGDILKNQKSKIKNQNYNSKLKTEKYKIVANIPYYLTSPLIRKFLEAANQPEFMLLMIQKEVAQRICAKPPKMTLLSVAAQFYAEPKIISYVSKKAFWPQPKVDSAIIKITPHIHSPVIASGAKQSPDITARLPCDLRSLAITTAFREHFFHIAKAAFSQPRKQLVNNLSKGLSLSREETKRILLKAGLQPTQRPSELSVDKYMEIAWIIWGK